MLFYVHLQDTFLDVGAFYFTVNILVSLSFMARKHPTRPGPLHYRGFTITLRQTPLGRTPLDKWSVRRSVL